MCARIREALSPNAVTAPHDSLGVLGEAQVELIHCTVNDPGRLSDSWAQSILQRGLSEGEYVETVGLIAMVMMLDMYPSPKAGYIYRGLSLVPQSLRDYWGLAFTHYLPSEFVYQFDRSIRAITRPQTEILAARVSAMHQCVY